MEQRGLAFPKGIKGKKRKKHKKSILQEKTGECFICKELCSIYRIQPVQEHHIFCNVANRKISEAEGLKVYLCLSHHTEGRAAVHNNIHMMRWLQVRGQREYEKEHTREAFLELYGRNYVDAYGEEVDEWERNMHQTFQH